MRNTSLAESNLDNQMTLDELDAYFECSLTAQTTDMTETLWKSNPHLREKYLSQDIPFEKLITTFKKALLSRATTIATDIWNAHLVIRNLFQRGESDTRLSNPKFMANFQLVVESGNSFIIEQICNNTARLRSALEKFKPQEELLTNILRCTQEIDFIKKIIVLFRKTVVVEVFNKEEFASIKNLINPERFRYTKPRKSKIRTSPYDREGSEKARERGRRPNGTWAPKKATESAQNSNTDKAALDRLELPDSMPLSLSSKLSDGLATPPVSSTFRFRLFDDPVSPFADDSLVVCHNPSVKTP